MAASISTSPAWGALAAGFVLTSSHVMIALSKNYKNECINNITNLMQHNKIIIGVMWAKPRAIIYSSLTSISLSLLLLT